jgi:hypothetical protein
VPPPHPPPHATAESPGRPDLQTQFGGGRGPTLARPLTHPFTPTFTIVSQGRGCGKRKVSISAARGTPGAAAVPSPPLLLGPPFPPRAASRPLLARIADPRPARPRTSAARPGRARLPLLPRSVSDCPESWWRPLRFHLAQQEKMRLSVERGGAESTGGGCWLHL